MNTKSCILLLFLFFESILLFSQEDWTTPIRVSQPGKRTVNYAMTLDNNGAVYIVWEVRYNSSNELQSQIFLRKSNDGITWGPIIAITDTGGMYWEPQVAVDSRGYIHVSYFSYLHYETFYKYYDGVSWSEPQSIFTVYTQDARILIDKNDVIHLIWAQWLTISRVYHRTITAGKWSEAEAVSDTTIRSGGIEAVLDEDNNIHTVFMSTVNPQHSYDIYYRKQENNVWLPIERINYDTVSSAIPQISIKEGKPFVVWRQFIPDTNEVIEKIYWCRKEGTVWSLPKPVNNLTRSSLPSVAKDIDKKIHLAWNQYFYGTSFIYLYYTLYDQDWQTPQLLNFGFNNSLGSPKISSYKKTLIMAFMKGISHWTQEVYITSKSILSDITESEQRADNNTLNVYPNPFNSETNINYSISSTSDVCLTIYDILGRVVKVYDYEEQSPGSYEIKFDASEISSGIYFCRLQTGNEFYVQKLLLTK